MCQFQVVCEVYLQMEPTDPLFKEFFYINRQTEFTDGPYLELSRVSIQRRRDGCFPLVTLPSHPKGWIKTWFYRRNTTLAGENPLLGYRPERLPMDFDVPSWVIP